MPELEDRLPFDLNEVSRAVIMISPFPELKPIAPQGRPAVDIVSIVSALLPCLIDQARFKPSEIILAADKGHGSRYLIGPSRATSDGKEQRYGIASGLLGGFGGSSHGASAITISSSAAATVNASCRQGSVSHFRLEMRWLKRWLKIGQPGST
jgi:hypothetical protein